MKTLFILLLVSTSITAKTPYEKIAQKIVQLRGEVELLNTQLTTAKSEYQNDVKGLSARRSQLEAQIQMEQLKSKKLLGTEEQLNKKIKEQSISVKDYSKFVGYQIDNARVHIESGIPFKKEKRLSELSKIEKELKAKKISSEVALSRLWAFAEDEMRLAKENSIHKQTVKINGEENFASVIKLGMVKMYFHTVDNRVGIVQNIDGEYVYSLINKKEQKERVFRLLDGIKKQIRYGQYDLPLSI